MFSSYPSFKAILEEKQRKTEEKLEAIAKKSARPGNGYTTIFPTIGQSEDENADEVANYTDLISLKSNLEEELEEINLALEKIKKGTYGICEKCGKKISRAKLEVTPTTRFCLKCKEK
ncbi:MAG: General stress protein 16O [Parcubacteria group bacterium ADurb.Bin159]|jgi:RNA polymerase-binding transcription factor DksA|nr:MAG: General stress protein 16O [Parcubacteria group bacterium ADurb.Bin159]